MGDPKLDPSQLRPVSGLEAFRAQLREKLNFNPREVVALAVLGVLVLAGAGLAYVRARPADASSLEPVAPSATATAAVDEGAIVVHVVGSVRKPGVFTFHEGDRVIDAVRAAGGFAPGADAIGINLARPLVDGEQIVVPKRGEAGAPPGGGAGGGSAQQGGKININLATVADFDSLPGIGPVLAQKIVDYREQHGPFKAITDLQKVSGIGPKKYASLEEHITV